MKVWIDKQGGTHYHKEFCRMITPMYHYEPIEHQLRQYGYPNSYYAKILIDGNYYYPCPICFGHGER